ncbi:hypothetical protein OG788_44380 [Streptomyces sp. NBC_00647]
MTPWNVDYVVALIVEARTTTPRRSPSGMCPLSWCSTAHHIVR